MKLHYHVGLNVIGGAETQLRSLISRLSPKHQILVTYQHAALKDFIGAMNVPNVWCRGQPDITTQIENFKPDVFQFYHCTDAFRAIKKSKHRPKTVEVIHNRCSFPGDASTYPKSYTDACVCVSKDAQNWLLERSPWVISKVIPNGVDTDVFFPAVNKPKRDRPLGGYAGRLEPSDNKGIDSLVRIIETFTDVDFELVGRDSGGWAVTLKNHTNIRVIDHLDNIADRMRQWDFFVSRSPAEGFGLSIAEALACGLPSVIYDCGGVTDHIKHGRHAFLAKNNNDVCRGIERVISGKHELRPTDLHLSVDAMARQYEDLYCRLTYQPKPEDFSV